MKALLPIIAEANDQLIVVVSAKGKTTNLLENIVHEACIGNKQKASELLKVLEEDHLDYASKVLNTAIFEKTKLELNEYFSELQWAVDDADAARFDYSYDQIVCMGEVLSTKIFCAYLQSEGLNYEWVDSRGIIRTDDTYRDAKVDWEYSKTVSYTHLDVYKRQQYSCRIVSWFRNRKIGQCHQRKKGQRRKNL